MHWVLFPADNREVLCFYIFWTALFFAGLFAWIFFTRRSGEQFTDRVGIHTTGTALGFANSFLTVISPFHPATFALVSSDFPMVYAFAGVYGLAISFSAFARTTQPFADPALPVAGREAHGD